MVSDDESTSAEGQGPAHLVLKLATSLWFVVAIAGYLYLGGSVALGWWPFDTSPSPETAVWWFSAAAGGLGATLYALRGFYWSVGPTRDSDPRTIYDPSWTWWYVLRPIAGSVLGLVGYVAIRIALSPVGVTAPADEQSTLAFVAIAFAAGFSLTRVLAWLDRWVGALFGERR